METFSTLLALCARNSPVTGEFPGQRPVTWSFDVFFDRRLLYVWVNNREAGGLRRHRAYYDVIVMSWIIIIWWPAYVRGKASAAIVLTQSSRKISVSAPQGLMTEESEERTFKSVVVFTDDQPALVARHLWTQWCWASQCLQMSEHQLWSRPHICVGSAICSVDRMYTYTVLPDTKERETKEHRAVVSKPLSY